MKFRVSEEALVEALEQDTAEVLDRIGQKPHTKQLAGSMVELKKAIRDLPEEVVPSLEWTVIVSAVEELPTMFNRLLLTILKSSIEYEARNSSVNECNIIEQLNFREGNTTFRYVYYVKFEDNLLSVSILKQRKRIDGKLFNYSYETVETIFEGKGKPTRILARLAPTEELGKEVARLVGLKYSSKGDTISVKFSKRYFPEHYFMLKKNENLSSCMAHKADYYGLPNYEHPLLPYENTDCVLILLWNETKGRAVGRAVGVIVENKIEWVRYYGNMQASKALLDCPYLDEVASLEGVKLNRIESMDGGILAPYVDGEAQKFDLYNSHLCIVESGEYNSEYETGRLADRKCCDCCGKYVCSDEMTSTGNGMVCAYCLEHNYVYLEREGEYIHQTYAVWSEYSCQYLREDDAWQSDWSDDYFCDYSEHQMEVELENGKIMTIHKSELDDVMSEEVIIAIDGESIIEEEEDEDAA